MPVFVLSGQHDQGDRVSVVEDAATYVVEISGDPTVVAVVEPVSVDTAPGATSRSQLRLTPLAATGLSGHRLVTPQPDGTVGYADPNDPAQIHAPLWLTLGAAEPGAETDVLLQGPVVEPSWSWAVGPVYLGPAGMPVQPAPVGVVFCAQVGYATGPTSLYLDRQMSIELI